MVNLFNWRMGVMALGALIFLVGLIVSQTLMRKTHPEAYGLLPDGDKTAIPHQTPPPQTAHQVPTLTIFKDSRFWTLAVCQGLAVMVSMSVFMHQVAYATDNGIGKIAAATSLAALSLTGFIGQFFYGWLSDRIKDPKYASFLGTSFMLIGMILLINARSISSLYIYALIYGFGYGSMAPGVPIIIAHRFGRYVMGSIYGLLTFFIGIGGSIGPILGGFIYDHFGSYRYLWLINIIVLICIAIAILTLKKGKQYTPAASSSTT
jgi:MFS family permease